jgi:phage gpG-like protein
MADLSFDLNLDQVTPSLSRLASEQLRDRLLQGIGTVIVSHAQRAFDEPGLRPASWKPRKSKKEKHPLLIKSGDLRQGLNFQKEGSSSIRMGSPTKYAATHQLGRDAIPARPFFPVLNNALTGNVTMEINDVVDALISGAAVA